MIQKDLLYLGDEFRHRHIGPNTEDTNEMLKEIGVSSLEELIENTVPAKIRNKKPMTLPDPLSENDYIAQLEIIAEENKLFKCYIGMGYFPTLLPNVILRNVLENPGWYTQYTPYQAEISQGRLEMLFHFQTMISNLTGLPIANASLLDEATAVAEAMTLADRMKIKAKESALTFIVDENALHQNLDLIKTRAYPLGIKIELAKINEDVLRDDVFAVFVQNPNIYGEIKDLTAFCKLAKEKNILTIIAVDLMSLVLCKSPGEMGADIAIGSAQRFGVPMGFGGPHAAFMATVDDFKRSIPGRIIGLSIDAQGKPAYRMALQTREQHIRREKATSNICTAQALLANISAMYAIYHGPKGLKSIAKRIHYLANILKVNLEHFGLKLHSQSYFDTITIIDVDGLRLKKIAERHQVNLRVSKDNVGISLSEISTLDDVKQLIDIFSEYSNKKAQLNEKVEITTIQQSLLRKDTILPFDVFHRYHNETDMMRYLKLLENKDVSLVHSMIPLGSCTMKLNAATEMIPVTWKQFASLHPFVPKDQAKAYYRIFEELISYLKAITGFEGISLQPNAGAQGEYAGLLTIKRFHESNGDFNRNIVLIPASAHGTNPATASMCGMKVDVVKCDSNGNIDMTDLKTKAEKNKDHLAGIMVTYPSTHGVFEEGISDLCDIIHQYGGQVYMDGANMNAQVGLTNPAIIGADVCHLNLHKTFCIPHGGGGPGMGPICVKKHLIPFLPGHSVISIDNSLGDTGAVSAAPFGSANILLISHAYIRMMGVNGLTDASIYSILNANYLRKKLEPSYPILYKGKNGMVAHEMILDCREFKKTASVEVEDIAKRLMDYSYHAPTVSFPVAGTLMVEPTESEGKGELDKFISVMIKIREEIQAIADGKMDKENNQLKQAPHTQEILLSSKWDRPYSREYAAYPLDYLRKNKMWPTVSRVNNVHGDRELICSCPDISEYI